MSQAIPTNAGQPGASAGARVRRAWLLADHEAPAGVPLGQVIAL